VSQNRTQPSSERQAFLLVYRDLCDAPKLILHGIFDRDDLVFVRLDFVYSCVQRSRLAGARRTCHQYHAVRLTDVPAKTPRLLSRKTNYVEVEALKLFRKRFLVQNAKHRVFTMTGGHDRNAQIDKAPLVLHTEAPVLWHTALRDV